MKDDYGRINNKAQVIRELNILEMAWLLSDIQNKPEKYPKTQHEWVKWLSLNSGDSLENL